MEYANTAPTLLQDMKQVERLLRLYGEETGNHSLEEDLLTLALSLTQKARRALQEKNARISALKDMADSDPLTGLLNRRGFEKRARQILDDAARHEDEGYLVYIDLDNFKPINDCFGHDVGDGLLKHVARLMENCLRSTDILARLGGDEFAILITRTENQLCPLERLRELFAGTLAQVGEHSVRIEASLGISSYQGGDDLIYLLKKSDRAMYSHKQSRKKEGGLRAAV